MIGLQNIHKLPAQHVLLQRIGIRMNVQEQIEEYITSQPEPKRSYILGIKDKKYLAQRYEKKLGKASISGYCIRFKTLKDVNIDILEAAIQYGIEVRQ